MGVISVGCLVYQKVPNRGSIGLILYGEGIPGGGSIGLFFGGIDSFGRPRWIHVLKVE